jgi:hypothetical protein
MKIVLEQLPNYQMVTHGGDFLARRFAILINDVVVDEFMERGAPHYYVSTMFEKLIRDRIGVYELALGIKAEEIVITPAEEFRKWRNFQ